MVGIGGRVGLMTIFSELFEFCIEGFGAVDSAAGFGGLICEVDSRLKGVARTPLEIFSLIFV